MIELKRHVERIVRPIRAEIQRKNKIREELLGHLLTIFEKEQLETDNVEEALASAKQRLGEVGVLRQELQESVPALERYGHTPIPMLFDLNRWIAESESKWRYAGRISTIAALFSIAVLAAMSILGFLLSSMSMENTSHLLLYTPICSFISAYVSVLAFEAMGGRARCGEASTTPALFKACMINVALILYVLLFFTLVVTLANIVQPGNYIYAAFCTVAWELRYELIAFPVANILTMSAALVFNRKQYEKWGSLEIEKD